MRSKLAFIAAGLVLLLACPFFLNGCSKKSAGKGGPPKMTVPVVGFKAKKQAVTDKISLVGTLEANEMVEIKNEVEGTIDQINFGEGQKVKKNDLLFLIDQNKLKASLDQTEANLKLAETTKDRYEALTQTGAISRQEYDQAAANLEINRATVELSKAELKDASIMAPFDGVMGERLVSVGQYINKGTSLGFVVSQDPIKASFRVPERYLNQLKIGQSIEVRVAAYTDETFTGEVFFIDPKIDALTRTALLKATLPNPDGKLRHGMFANLQLIVNIKADAIVIPETALIVKGDSVAVYTIDAGDSAVMNPVKVGTRMAGLVEIEDGIKEGDPVVIEGYQKLVPGMKVKVRYEDKLHQLNEPDPSAADDQKPVPGEPKL